MESTKSTKQKLRVREFRAALLAGGELAAFHLIGIFHIVYDVADGSIDTPAFADVQGHDSRGRQCSCSHP